MRLLGVDPGFTGALAIYDTDLGIIEVLDMPCRELKTDATVKQEVAPERIREWLSARPEIDLACVEKVASRPGQGVAAMFGFGEATGTVIGVLAGLGIPIVRMRPQEWQRKVKLKGGEFVKDHSRDKAVMLFPSNAALFGRKKDSGRSDAVLIAYALTQ